MADTGSGPNLQARSLKARYLKAMGIEVWVARGVNAEADVYSEPVAQTPAITESAALHQAPVARSQHPLPPAEQQSVSPASKPPDSKPISPTTVSSTAAGIAQWPANSLGELTANCRVALAQAVETNVESGGQMLLVFERELTPPTEDLLAAMLKAIGVDRLSQSAATITDAANAETIAEVCSRLRPSIVLVMATLSDVTALAELEPHRKALHSFPWLNVPVAITLHPQVLLDNPKGKRPAWEDLKRVKTFLDGQ